jgi:hypothetical protein
LRDPARSQFVNWDETTDVLVSGLRDAAGGDPDDPQLRSLIDELSRYSDYFTTRWARADVGYRAGVIHIRHPGVGDMYLHPNRFNIPHSGGQHLLTFRAYPKTESAQALEKLHGVGSGTLARPQALS